MPLRNYTRIRNYTIVIMLVAYLLFILFTTSLFAANLLEFIYNMTIFANITIGSHLLPVTLMT